MNVWQTLSKIDVSEHVEKKGNLSYLSWAWAWGTLMNHYPEAKYQIGETKFFDDGTAEVWVMVEVEGMVRDMWLPVMDHRNKAIPNPSSRDISDSRMRCLVKCLAMFGLGHYLYAGEDLPEKKGAADRLKEAKNADELAAVWRSLTKAEHLEHAQLKDELKMKFVEVA